MLKKHKSTGFTLTELLIVMGIIAFLVLLAIFFFRIHALKGRDAKRKGDLHTMQVAVEEYEKDNNYYPPNNLIVCDPGTGLQPYLSKIPCDPLTGDSYYYNIEGIDAPGWYRIYAELENTKDSDIYGTIGPGGSYNYYVGSPNAPEPPIVGTGGDYYACFSGICMPVDEGDCEPQYQNPTCYGQCGNGNPENECTLTE